MGRSILTSKRRTALLAHSRRSWTPSLASRSPVRPALEGSKPFPRMCWAWRVQGFRSPTPDGALGLTLAEGSSKEA
ncbi:hypothetical protein IFM51744_11200 [Aspergillus udagawae]|nr:hypothetical protein IFM51744_11200 [Aspergillus udagawae]